MSETAAHGLGLLWRDVALQSWYMSTRHVLWQARVKSGRHRNLEWEDRAPQQEVRYHPYSTSYMFCEGEGNDAEGATDHCPGKDQNLTGYPQ